MSLLSRIILIVLVAQLPLLGAQVYNQHALRVVQRTALRDEARRQARSAADELGRILDGARSALVALAAMPSIRDWDGPACTALLDSVRSRLAFLSMVALVDSNDRVVCASGGQAAPGARADVRKARETGQFAAAAYPPGEPAGAGRLATALPLMPGLPPPGLGPSPVLIADIGLDWLNDQLRPLAARDGSAITVVDRTGAVLAAAAEGPATGSTPDFVRAWLGDGRTEQVVQAGDGMLGVVPVADLLVAVRPDPSGETAAGARAAWRSFWAFAGGLALALAGAGLLARRTLTDPVEHILRAIARWQGGDAQARVVAPGPRSELGRIALAVNELFAAFGRTERGLRSAKAELEQRVAERTIQLDAEVHEREQAQALLQQAQKMEVIGQLTGGVAHDFNNLLTAVIGNLELAILRSRDRPDLQRLLENALRAAERGTSLTQRMLAFGRQQYLRLQPVDVSALLAGMEDLLARTIGPTIEIRIKSAEGLWPARADPNQLELVMLNLAINARDAMPGGGVLSIVASNDCVAGAEVGSEGPAHAGELADADYVRIALNDAGTGIEPETLQRVLEPFFTTKPAGKGSGLGLSMAQGVAAQSGGGLTIESKVGHGTTVTVWFPRAHPDAGEGLAEQQLQADQPADAAGSRPGVSILLVDDDVQVAEVAQQCLEDEGFFVTCAHTGAAALALLDAGTPMDVLIADLAMPGMNGLQLAARARTRHPGLPVLLATGYADAQPLAPAGSGYAVLEKPFKAVQLIAAVTALLPTARRRTESAMAVSPPVAPPP